MSKSEILAAIEELRTSIYSLQASVDAPTTNTFPPATAPDLCWFPSSSPPPITPAQYLPPSFSPIPHTTHSTSLLPIRRLSPSEIEEKNDCGLCYNCDQTWSDTHRCRSKFLILFGTDDEDDFGDPKSPAFMAGVEATVENVSSPSPFPTTHSTSPIFSPSAPSAATVTPTDLPFIDAPPHLPSKAIPPHSVLHSPTPLPSTVLQPPPPTPPPPIQPPPTEPYLDLLPSPAITPSVRSKNKKPSPTVIFGSKTGGPKGLIAAVSSPSVQENDRGPGSPFWLLVGPEDESVSVTFRPRSAAIVFVGVVSSFYPLMGVFAGQEVQLCGEPPPDLLGIPNRFHTTPYQFLRFVWIMFVQVFGWNFCRAHGGHRFIKLLVGNQPWLLSSMWRAISTFSGATFLYSTGAIQLLCVTDAEMVKEMILCTSLNLGKLSYLSTERGPLLGRGIPSLPEESSSLLPEDSPRQRTPRCQRTPRYQRSRAPEESSAEQSNYQRSRGVSGRSGEPRLRCSGAASPGQRSRVPEESSSPLPEDSPRQRTPRCQRTPRYQRSHAPEESSAEQSNYQRSHFARAERSSSSVQMNRVKSSPIAVLLSLQLHLEDKVIVKEWGMIHSAQALV